MEKLLTDIGEHGSDGDRLNRPARHRTLRTVALTALATAAAVLLLTAIGSYFYWQHLKGTPQYALASLVDAAKRDDTAAVDAIVDIDAVVDDFLPQITSKAIELYGRGTPQELIERISKIAAPVMPAVKERGRAELPAAIRRKTETFGDVPFVAMVLGAEKYLDVSVVGDRASVRSKVPGHHFEVTMSRTTTGWRIIGVRDDELATQIAQRIGQEIVAIAVNGTGAASSRLGIRNINQLLREAEVLFE